MSSFFKSYLFKGDLFKDSTFYFKISSLWLSFKEKCFYENSWTKLSSREKISNGFTENSFIKSEFIGVNWYLIRINNFISMGALAEYFQNLELHVTSKHFNGVDDDPEPVIKQFEIFVDKQLQNKFFRMVMQALFILTLLSLLHVTGKISDFA